MYLDWHLFGSLHYQQEEQLMKENVRQFLVETATHFFRSIEVTYPLLHFKHSF